MSRPAAQSGRLMPPRFPPRRSRLPTPAGDSGFQRGPQRAPPAAAIAAYTRYIETPWSYRWLDPLLGDAVFLVPAHFRLALLHDEFGNVDAAARHAAEVVRLWDDADPLLQDRVRAMRRILGQVAGEG